MANPACEHDASSQQTACSSTVNCKLPHASCTPAANVPAVPPENPFGFGATAAIAVCAFVLAGAATLIFGVAEKMRPIVGWFEALRSKCRRGK